MGFQAMRRWFASMVSDLFGIPPYQTAQPARHLPGAERADLRINRQRLRSMLLEIERHPFASPVIISLCTSLTLCAKAHTAAAERICIRRLSSNEWQVTLRNRSIAMPTISGCLLLLQTAGVSLAELRWEPCGSSLREVLTSGHRAKQVTGEQQMVIRSWGDGMWIATIVHRDRNRSHFISASLEWIEAVLKVPVESKGWYLGDPDML